MKYQIISERTVTYDAVIKYPTDLLPVLKRYRTKRKEHFISVTLDASHKPIKVHLVSIGILNKTLVHPREIFRTAIVDGAAAVIIVHNHPSGLVEPSAEDRDVTRRLADSGKLLGIPVIDHLIISKDAHYSFAESCETCLNN